MQFGLLELISRNPMLFQPFFKKKKKREQNSACIFDSTSDSITIFHFSQSFSFKLFLFLATTSSSVFSDCALQSFLFQIVQKQFFNLLIYLTCSSIEIAFLAHKKQLRGMFEKFA